MGDPRRQRRRYTRPMKLWTIARITEENELCKKYGLKNKKEVWRAKTAVGRFRQQARCLLGSTGETVEKDKKDLIERLSRLGLLESKSIDDVLALNIENLLDRRLQTIVYKKGLASTINQARQFVVHGHVYVGTKAVTAPRYPVRKGEEDLIRVSDKAKVINVGEGRGDKAKEAAPKEAG